MRKKWLVRLTTAQRAELERSLRAGAAPARQLTRARLLLKADQGPAGPAWRDAAIAAAFDICVATVEQVR